MSEVSSKLAVQFLKPSYKQLETAMAKAYQLHIQGDPVIAREILRKALGVSIMEQSERLKEYNETRRT